MVDLYSNIKDVMKKINMAAQKSKFKQDVKLIAVSKTYTSEVITEAYNGGVKVFGENRVQELLYKKPLLPEDIEWHLIGPLQTNKVKAVLPHVQLIHSLDRPSLVEELEKRSEELGREVKVLVEVNVAKEASKHGLHPEEVKDFIYLVSEKKYIKIQGLMTVAPFTPNPEEVRWVFSNLRQLSLDINKYNLKNVEMSCLSMGMTNDFEIAIEEGANLVRIGSGIFGAR